MLGIELTSAVTINVRVKNTEHRKKTEYRVSFLYIIDTIRFQMETDEFFETWKKCNNQTDFTRLTRLYYEIARNSVSMIGNTNL